MTRSGPMIPVTGASRSGWWHFTGGPIGGFVGVAAGTILTIASFFHFLAARLGPLYNGDGKSVFYVLWVLPFAPIWGFTTGGVLVSRAMWLVADRSERYSGGDEERRLALRRVYGIVAILIVPLVFWAGCAVFGYVLQFLV